MAHDATSGDLGAGNDAVSYAVPFEGSLLSFKLPWARRGELLVVVIVHDDPIYRAESASTWSIIASAVGADGLFLTVAARQVDGSAGSRNGDVVEFFSEVEQELQGAIRVLPDAAASSVLEAIEHGAFVADPAPPAPLIDSSLADNWVMVVCSADGSVTLTPPDNLDEVDSYGSSVFDARSITAASMVAGAADTIDPGAITASAPATGRIWSLVFHYTPNQVRPLVSTRSSELAGLFDLYIDPITKDYVDTDDGEWLEVPDSRTLVMVQIDMHFGADYFAPGDGTRIRELLEQGVAPPDELVVSETRRALQVVVDDGTITDLEVTSRRRGGELVVDCSWRDRATGMPVDHSFTPTGGV